MSMIAAALPLAGGVLDGKAKDISCYVHELGRIVKGVWNRYCAAVSFRLREMAELFRFQLGWSAQRLDEQACPSSSFGCNNAVGWNKFLPVHSFEGSDRRDCADKFDINRRSGREDDLLCRNYRNIHGAFLFRNAVRVAASRGGYSR